MIYAPDQVITDYGKRWSIETLFALPKFRGFNLDTTQRLSQLIPEKGTLLVFLS
jgi:hypothetical protein